MKRLIFIITLFLVYQQLFTQTTDNLQISLITCNPGNELYSVFGHSAIRVIDRSKGYDKVYNYGTFDFNTPNFYLKFARGYLNYELTVSSMRRFMAEYRHTNRSVFEQVLILNDEEKQKIYNSLEYNAQPENKFYQYDFFFDNCATRIRDICSKEFAGSLKFNAADYKAQTFREMILPYLEAHKWSRFGINLVLGQVADKEADLNDGMFLPDYLKMVFAGATFNDKLLCAPVQTLFKQTNTDNRTAFLKSPIFVFSAIFLLIALSTYFEIKRKKRFKLIDFMLFLSVGITGLILFLLWFATNHKAVVENWNLIWAVPIHLFVAFGLFRQRKSFWRKYYFLLVSIAAILVLPFWFIIPQHLDFAIIPILLMISLRAFRIFRYY